jgi:ribosome-associated protein
VAEPGSDLVVPPGPGLPSGTTVPAGELTERFSRSPGPGGQSVNTSDTRVELLFDPAGSSAFTEPQLRRILAVLPAGPISVTASEHRSQLRNRGAARDRLIAILRQAVAPPPPPRRPTKPTKGSQRRRVEAKKQRGQTKALRRRVTGD